jgi:FkbM family methyltransferase
MATNSDSMNWVTELPLVLYGAGNAGRVVASRLTHQGARIEAFLDQSGAPGEFRDGVPVHTLEGWATLNEAQKFNMLISIFNPFVDIIPILEMLSRVGFNRILTMYDYINACSDYKDNWYWLAPSSFYADKDSKLELARSLLTDEHSRQWFDGSLEFRKNGDFRSLPRHSLADQYMPIDLPRWPTRLRIVDCGAYSGDSIKAFKNNRYEIESVIAFEPDPDNYPKLVRSCDGLDAVCLPCGVSGETTQQKFDSGLGPSCRISDEGTFTIQCVAIDDAIPNFAPNLIKMDIEGAELSALHGAEKTLHRFRPSMAVSVYHSPEDLWEIPLWVASLGLNYRMYLRGHGANGFDTVLYCRAE